MKFPRHLLLAALQLVATSQQSTLFGAAVALGAPASSSSSANVHNAGSVGNSGSAVASDTHENGYSISRTSDSINTLVKYDVGHSDHRDLQAVTAAYWKTFDWGMCNLPCGGGSMTRLVICWGNVTQRETDPAQCLDARPIRKTDCNMELCPSVDVTEFSCDPAAIGGSQRCGPMQKDGGRLSISVYQASSLPKLDSVLAGLTDPYVIVRMGGHSWSTKVSRNTINPRWGAPGDTYTDRFGVVHGNAADTKGETFFAGLRLSGTPIVLEIWDSDGGLEGADDLIARIKTTVIGCAFASENACDERTWLPLRAGSDCFLGRNSSRPNPVMSCLQVRQSMTSHNVSMPIDAFLPTADDWNMSMSMSNPFNDLQPSAARLYTVSGDRLDAAWSAFELASQGIVLTNVEQARTLPHTPVSASIDVNYKSFAYYFRYTVDGSADAYTPAWLMSDSWLAVHPDTGKPVLARILGAPAGEGLYRAHIKKVKSFSTLRIGPVISEEEVGEGAPIPDRNGFTVLKMIPDDIPTPPLAVRSVDPVSFANTLLPFLLPQLLLIFLILPFCWEIQFRLDLVQPYLATRALPHLKQAQRRSPGSAIGEGVTSALDALFFCCRTPRPTDEAVKSSAEFTLPYSREHVLAACMLDHPDVVRCENERRRRLELDVSEFFSEIVIDESVPGDPQQEARGVSRAGSAGKERSAVKMHASKRSNGDGASDPNGALLDGHSLSSAEESGSSSESEGEASHAHNHKRTYALHSAIKDDDEEIIKNETVEEASARRAEELEYRRLRNEAGEQGLDNSASFRGLSEEDDMYEVGAWAHSEDTRMKREEKKKREEAHALKAKKKEEEKDERRKNGGLDKGQGPGSASASSSRRGSKHGMVTEWERGVSASGQRSALSSTNASSRVVPQGMLGDMTAPTAALSSSQPPSSAGRIDTGKSSKQSGFSDGLGPEESEKRSYSNDIRVPPIIEVASLDGTLNWHRSLFWLTVLCYTLLLSPWVINIAHGIVLLRGGGGPPSSAPAAGWAVLLVGSASYALLVGLGQWASGGYRATAEMAWAVSAAAALLLAFPCVALLTDSLPTDLRALTIASAATSFVPLALAAFLNAESLGDSLRSIGAVAKLGGLETEEASDVSLPSGTGRAGGAALPIARPPDRHSMPVHLPTVLGVPLQAGPAVSSVIGTAAALCLAHAVDPAGAEAAGNVAKSRARAAALGQSMGRDNSGRGAESTSGSNTGTGTGDELDPAAPSPSTPRSLVASDAEGEGDESALSPLAPTAGFTTVEGVRVADRHLVDGAAFFAAVAAQKGAVATAQQKAGLARIGASLGLNKDEDALLRLAAVASAPWLQPTPAFARAAEVLGHDPTHPLPKRSHTSVLGGILGSRVFTALHASPTADLFHADGIQGLLSSHPATVRRITRLCMAAVFLLHGLHALFVALSFPSSPWNGLATALGWVVQDGVMISLLINKLVNRSPEWFCALSLVSRIFTAIYAGRTWLAGLGFAYGVWGCALGFEAGINRLPHLTETASELIALLSTFEWGDEYASAVKKANVMARSFEATVAALLGIDLAKDYSAMAVAARKTKRKKVEKKKARKTKGPDDDSDEEDDGKKAEEEEDDEAENDPYDLSALRAKAAELRAGLARTTPMASKYGAGQKIGADDGTKAKTSRFAGTRVLEGKSSSVSAKRAGRQAADAAAKASRSSSLGRAGTSKKPGLNSSKVAPEPAAVQKTVPQMPGVARGVDDDGRGGGASTRISAPPPRLRGGQKRSFFEKLWDEIKECREAWAGLAWLTLLYVPVLLASAIFEEYNLWYAATRPVYEAGLYDSRGMYDTPTLGFFQVEGIKAWVVGVSCVGVSWTIMLMAGAASAWQLRAAGMLPPTFDIPLPFMTKTDKRLHRIEYPQFLAGLTQFVATAMGILLWIGTGSGMACLLSILSVPAIMCAGLIGLSFVRNGYSMLEPGTARVRMSRARLVLLNARAGYVLGDPKFRKWWRNQHTDRESRLMDQLEFDRNAPKGSKMSFTSLFELECVTGDLPLGPNTDLHALEVLLSPHSVSAQASVSGAGMGRRQVGGAVQVSASLAGRAALGNEKKDSKTSVDGKKEGDEEEEEENSDGEDLKKGKKKRAIPKRKGTWGDYFSRQFYKWHLRRIDPATLGLTEAWLRGYLTEQDVTTLNTTLGLALSVLALGLVAAMVLENPLLGHLLWIIPATIALSALPAMTFATTQKWTIDLVLPFLLSLGMSTAACALMLVSADNPSSPQFDGRTPFIIATWGGYWAIAAQALAWIVLAKRAFIGNATTSVLFLFSYLCWAGVVFVAWGWGSYAEGFALGLALAASMGLQVLSRVWGDHGGRLPASARRGIAYVVAGTVITCALVPAFIPEIHFFYAGSVGCFFLIAFYGGRCLARWLELSAMSDTPLLLGPMLLPAFSYDPVTGGLVCEDAMVKDAAAACAVTLGWATYALMFVDPILPGVAATFGVETGILVLVLAAASHSPLALGQFAAFLDIAALRAARVVATDTFFARRRLLPVLAAIGTSNGATVVDSYANGCSGLADVLRESLSVAEVLAAAEKVKSRGGVEDEGSRPVSSAGVRTSRSASARPPSDGHSSAGPSGGSLSARGDGRGRDALSSADSGQVPGLGDPDKARSRSLGLPSGRDLRSGLRAMERQDELLARVSQQLAWLDPASRDRGSIRAALITREAVRRAKVAALKEKARGARGRGKTPSTMLTGGQVAEPLVIRSIPVPYEGERRVGFAQHSAALAVSSWAGGHAWPWQVKDGEMCRELVQELGSRLALAAQHVFEAHDKKSAQLRKWGGWILPESTIASWLSAFVHKEAALAVNRATASLTALQDVTDLRAMGKGIVESHLIVPELACFTAQLVHSLSGGPAVGNARGKLSPQEVAARRVALVRLAKEKTGPLAVAIAMQAGTVQMQDGDKARGRNDRYLLPAPGVIQNLWAAVNPKAAAAEEEQRARKGAGSAAQQEAVRAAAALAAKIAKAAAERGVGPRVGSRGVGPPATEQPDTEPSPPCEDDEERVVAQGGVFGPFIVGPVSAGGRIPAVRTASVRGLEKLSMKAHTARSLAAAEGATPAQSVRAKGIKGKPKPSGLQPDAAPSSLRTRPAPAREMVFMRGAGLGGASKETFRESFNKCDCFAFAYKALKRFFWTLSADATPLPEPPRWQLAAGGAFTIASNTYARLTAKRGAVSRALDGPMTYADTAQLLSLLCHPLYAPVPRPDRPWTGLDALTDTFLLGRGPFALFALFGVAQGVLSAVWEGVALACTRARMRTCGTRAARISFERALLLKRALAQGHGASSSLVPADRVVGWARSRERLHALAALPADSPGNVISRVLTSSLGKAISAREVLSAFEDPFNFPSVHWDGQEGEGEEGGLRGHSVEHELDRLLDWGLGPDAELYAFKEDEPDGAHAAAARAEAPDDLHSLSGSAGSCLFGMLTTGVSWVAASPGVTGALDIEAIKPYVDVDKLAALEEEARVRDGHLGSRLSRASRAGTVHPGTHGSAGRPGTGLTGTHPPDTPGTYHSHGPPHTSSTAPSHGAVEEERRDTPGSRGRTGRSATSDGPGSVSVQVEHGGEGEQSALDKARAFPKPMRKLQASRAASPPSMQRVFARRLRASHACGVDWYEESRALTHFGLLLVCYGRTRRDAQRARFPAFFELGASQLSKLCGVNVPDDVREAACRRDIRTVSTWLSLLDTRAKDVYAGSKDVFDAQMAGYKAFQGRQFVTVSAAAERRREELSPRLIEWRDETLAAFGTLRGDLREKITAKRITQAYIDASKIDLTKSTTLPAGRSGLSFNARTTKAAELDATLSAATTNVVDEAAVRAKAMLDPLEVDDVMLAHVAVVGVERGRENCVSRVGVGAGASVRPFQFVDPAFQPGPAKLGQLYPATLNDMMNLRWTPAGELVPDSSIFAAGCDPDDVNGGFALKDGWLLAAICMLACSSGVGDDAVDALIDNVFITKRVGVTGVAALRLFLEGQWVPVLLDDALPCLKLTRKSDWGAVTPRCKGVGGAHSSDLSELWPSLMEKALAKVFGSYAELNRGFVEHALEAFTGAPARRIPLQVVGDGLFRTKMWRDLKAWYTDCRYLLGVETFAGGGSLVAGSANALLPNGLAASSVYLIYDIRQVGDVKLVLLREPPGVKSDWRGAFCPGSSSWTLRLMSELEYDDVQATAPEQRTLWMDFDDFLTHFQALYVCETRDPKVWKSRAVAGLWRGPTAGGLVRKDGRGPGAIHRNPQWELLIRHETTVTFTLQQFLVEEDELTEKKLDGRKHSRGSSRPGTRGSTPAGAHAHAHASGARADIALHIPCALYVTLDAAHAVPASYRHDAMHYCYSGHGRGAPPREGEDYDDDGVGPEDDEDDAGNTLHLTGRHMGTGPARAAAGLMPHVSHHHKHHHHHQHHHVHRPSSRGPEVIFGREDVSQSAEAQRALEARTVTMQEMAMGTGMLGRESGVPAVAYSDEAMEPLFNSGDSRVFALTSTNVVATTGTPSAAEMQILTATLRPGKYVLIAACGVEDSVGGFGVLVQSTEPLHLRRLWPIMSSKAEMRADERKRRRMLAASKGSRESAEEQFGKSLAEAKSSAAEEALDAEAEELEAMKAETDGAFGFMDAEDEDAMNAEQRAAASVVQKGSKTKHLPRVEETGADRSAFRGGLDVMLATAMYAAVRAAGLGADGGREPYVLQRREGERESSKAFSRVYAKVHARLMEANDSIRSGGSWLRHPAPEVAAVLKDYDLDIFHHEEELAAARAALESSGKGETVGGDELDNALAQSELSAMREKAMDVNTASGSVLASLSAHEAGL